MSQVNLIEIEHLSVRFGATAVVDETVRASRATIHRGPDGVIPPASALAIVESEVSVYLFHCDREWQVLADTWHTSASEAKAQAEFDAFVNKLTAFGVDVTVVDDTLDPDTPDSIFPNNWISFHSNGDVALYPMFAENRRP